MHALYSNVEHPWENGLAGRSFGVVFAIARALLHDAQCPNQLCGHAILHACYLRNRRLSKKCSGKSPVHHATSAPADLSKLRVFGCPAMVHARERQRPDPKLDHRSVLTMFVGVSTHCQFALSENKFIFLDPQRLWMKRKPYRPPMPLESSGPPLSFYYKT